MNLDKRQKIILVILVVLVIFLIWQIFGLRSPHTSPPITTTKTTKMVEIPTHPPTGPAHPPSLSEASAPEATFTQPQLMPPQQAEYLRTVDEYQLAQIKRMLAEQLAATAQADQTTAKAKSETNKLISATSGTFIPQTTTETTLISSTAQTSANLTTPASAYQVVYIGTKEGRWSAILAKNGQYIIVTPGQVLADQSAVTEINNNGVALKMNDSTTFIPFQTNLIG